MREIANFDEVKEITGDYEKLPAGGYICKITSVEDNPDKEYLNIEFDIAQGEYAGWFAENYQARKFWSGKFIRSYKDSAVGFFKAFTNAVEQSNPGYKWAWQEKTLVNKLIGLVLGYEEYENKMGDIKERLRVVQVKNIEAIKKGNFKVPELKKLYDGASTSNDALSGFTEMSSDNLPF